MDKYILDTNAIIYYLKNKEEVNFLFDNLIFNKIIQPIISIITEIELLSYLKISPAEENHIAKLLELFTVIEVHSIIGKQASQIKRKYSLKLGDSIIAATAITEGCCLISFDKIFARCQEIKIKTLKNLEKSYHKNIKS